MRFADKNLRLAVLEALVAREVVSRPTRMGGLESRYHRDVLEQLDAVRPTGDQLAQLESVTWHARLECVHQIFPQWDGEDEAFDITQLAGIEACKNLCALELSMFVGTDLQPLAQLTKLETLELAGGEKRIADLSPLAELTRLRSVTLDAIVPNAANSAVIAKLRAQGTDWCIGGKRIAADVGAAKPATSAGHAARAHEPVISREPASPAGHASLDELHALEREGARLIAKESFACAVDVYARALTMREMLAEQGELAPGATGKRPEMAWQPGAIQFASEPNVLAGVMCVAHALACTRQEKERLAHLLRAGAMLAEAGRDDSHVFTFLSNESVHASDNGLDDEAVELATLAVACATRAGRDIQKAAGMLADVRARGNVRSARGAAAKAARESLDGLRVIDLEAKELERAEMHAKHVIVCKKGLALRRVLAARGELAAGAGGTHIPRETGWSPSFVAESNVLAGLSRLASALHAAGKKAAALPYTLEACEALIAAGRSESDALSFLLGGAREALQAKQPAVALRLATVARERAAATGAQAALEASVAVLASLGASA